MRCYLSEEFELTTRSRVADSPRRCSARRQGAAASSPTRSDARNRWCSSSPAAQCSPCSARPRCHADAGGGVLAGSAIPACRWWWCRCMWPVGAGGNASSLVTAYQLATLASSSVTWSATCWPGSHGWRAMFEGRRAGHAAVAVVVAHAIPPAGICSRAGSPTRVAPLSRLNQPERPTSMPAGPLWRPRSTNAGRYRRNGAAAVSAGHAVRHRARLRQITGSTRSSTTVHSPPWASPGLRDACPARDGASRSGGVCLAVSGRSAGLVAILLSASHDDDHRRCRADHRIRQRLRWWHEGLVLGFAGVLLFIIGFNFGFGSLVWVYAMSPSAAVDGIEPTVLHLDADGQRDRLPPSRSPCCISRLGGANREILRRSPSSRFAVSVPLCAGDQGPANSREIRHFWENGGRWPAERSPAADEP